MRDEEEEEENTSPLLLVTLNTQFTRYSWEALEPLTVRLLPALVAKFIPDTVTLPDPENVQFPKIVTLGVYPSQVLQHTFTPALKVGFSVYVPGIINTVSPDVADDRALESVVWVPSPATVLTTHFSEEKKFI